MKLKILFEIELVELKKKNCQLEPDSNIIVEDHNITIDKVRNLNPNKVIISPEPCHPKYETGNVIPIIMENNQKY